MKLLGWMHQKIRQNSKEPFKDFMIGNYCTCISAQSALDDDQDYHSDPSAGFGYGPKSLNKPKEESGNFHTFENQSMEDSEEEISTVIPELFHGFLTIGTLGSEPNISEPMTPTFAMCLDGITEKNMEVTHDDLKLINEELEKFLEAEAEEGSKESSGRNSYVSTITLSDKQMDGANAENSGKIGVCPLQGYLFGSAIELAETRIEAKKEKVSLAELFNKTKVADENSAGKSRKDDVHAKPTHKSNKNFINKVLKKLHVASKSTTQSPDDTATGPVSPKKKFHKLLRTFHRKIHPETSLAEGGLTASYMDKIKLNPYNGNYSGEHPSTLSDRGYTNGDGRHPNEDKRRFPQEFKSKEGTQSHIIKLKLAQHGQSGSDSVGNKEQWIKTDANYLVLEL